MGVLSIFFTPYRLRGIPNRYTQVILGTTMVGGPLPPLLVSVVPSHAVVVARPRTNLLVVRATPSGSVVARLGRRTDFGSPLVISVAKRRGRWLGVITSSMPNGRLGWIRTRAVRTAKVPLRLEVSLSARKLLVLRGDVVVKRIRVGIGASSTPTPTGRFAITDKLAGAEFGAAYGCCVLALSGNQPHPPPGWNPAESRLGIHGGGLGAASAGCLHAPTSALRYLMKRVPLGTRITIRA
jgi:hypothetical protein